MMTKLGHPDRVGRRSVEHHHSTHFRSEKVRVCQFGQINIPVAAVTDTIHLLVSADGYFELEDPTARLQ
jgi:hypothetical protein